MLTRSFTWLLCFYLYLRTLGDRRCVRKRIAENKGSRERERGGRDETKQESRRKEECVFIVEVTKGNMYTSPEGNK